MQPITPMARTVENIALFKEKSCTICLDDNFDKLGGAVQHCDGHMFHAECLDQCIEKCGPFCPSCATPLLPRDGKPLSWKEKIEWFICVQPWLLGLIYRKDAFAGTILSFANFSMGVVDLHLTRKKYEELRKKINDMGTYLANFAKIEDPSPKQKSLRIYYEWFLKTQGRKSLDIQQDLSRFHLVRIAATFALGFRYLIMLKNKKGP